LGHKADFAPVNEYALRASLPGSEEQHAKSRNKRAQQNHDREPQRGGFVSAAGSIFVSTASRSTKWCLSAAAACIQTSPRSVKFNPTCQALKTPASALSLGNRS